MSSVISDSEKLVRSVSKWPITMCIPLKQEPLCHVHLEVRWRSAWSVFPLLCSPPPSPFQWQREPVWLPRKQAFSMAMLEHVGRAGRLCFARDEGLSPCIFNRQTYDPKPNSRAHLPKPDYVQWSFWHRHFAGFITLCPSHRGHLRYCCTAFLMSTAETTDSQSKQGGHKYCLFTRTGDTPGQINTFDKRTYTETHIGTGTQSLFVFFGISAPTLHCLA